jgi:hypothetical protein
MAAGNGVPETEDIFLRRCLAGVGSARRSLADALDREVAARGALRAAIAAIDKKRIDPMSQVRAPRVLAKPVNYGAIPPTRLTV